MVRKQLYITAEQELALKAHARSCNQTEAGIVREALVEYLSKTNETGLRDDKTRLVQDLIKANHALARSVSFPKGYVFDRNEGYRDREERQTDKGSR